MVTLSQKATDHSDSLPQIDGPNADIVIRTSDDVNLEVHSSVLSGASPYFRQVLAGPAAPPSYSGTLCRIPVPENSRTFRHLLRFMYPGMIHPRPSGWDETKLLFEAFLKYETEGSESFKTVLDSLLDTSKQPPEKGGFINHASHATSILCVYATIWTHRVTLATAPELNDLPAPQLTKLFQWVQSVKMSIHSHSFERWDEKDRRFEYPCPTLIAHFSKPGANVASLLGSGFTVRQELISKTRLLEWYEGIFVPSFKDRRPGHMVALSPESWACEFCESLEAETTKLCLAAIARKIR
ncbi:hypothetical protein AAF712_015539 [Marasmius tenuissimus]|uniref:BTB domain-containing protein n=1 Tax=Marasmius tenuissimus TaxID=585030 RepID=A0ABR2ZAK3_9AGAR